MSALRSSCCDARIEEVSWGTFACARCGAPIYRPPSASRRDIIEWLFKPESGPRPQGEPVFVRYGKKLELLPPGKVKGHPDSWSWGGA